MNSLTLSQKMNKTLFITILVLFALTYLGPLYVMLTTSFKGIEEIRNGNILALPQSLDISAWAKAWSSACTGGDCFGLAPYFWNSMRIVIPALVISTAVGALNGYVLSQWQFKGSNFTTLFFRNYYVGIPNELVRAAKLDGAGFFSIFRHIFLPLSTPIIVVSIIWQFTQIWNDFLFGVVYSGPGTQPITVALNNLVNTTMGGKEYNVDMAAAVIAALPTLVVYVVAGKYFVRGLTAAVKG